MGQLVKLNICGQKFSLNNLLYKQHNEKPCAGNHKNHRDNETNSWMPLYLASDVLAFESIGNCNKSRIHASFAKQGLATKITLPTGVKFSRLPAGNSNGVWFYSVYGVIQAVMQYLNSQEEQIRLIEEFMSIWKLRVNDPLLPQKLDHFTVVNKSRSIPMPVDLRQNASYLSRNSGQSTVGSANDEEMLVSCIIPSSGCVVGSKRSRTDSIAQRLDEELFDVPDVAVEVSISSDSLCKLPLTHQEGSSPTEEGRCGIKMERNFLQPELSSHARLKKFDVKVNQDTRDDSKSPVTAEECQDRENRTFQRFRGCRNHLSNGKCKFASSEQSTNRRELVKEFCEQAESLISLPVTDLQVCWLQTFSQLILDEVLKFDAGLCSENSQSSVGDLWTNSSLICISQWLGEKFNLLVPVVAEKVDSFKKANFNQITELPSDREMIRELFPAAMYELFSKWIDVAMHDRNHLIDSPDLGGTHHIHSSSSKETNKLGIYSLLLLLLEFSNQALVSGVAHVLYPRFVAS
ncbi:hypothetical protein BSL78_14987 [Apostichopus japonicus]|uniref:Uncharacterized protein n=1 Tax=Stichopus japonicus TaxID=307972 RepID=A0A2G8KJH4_STIJA|nr:hypothetical protein BSL78_14987 [Apostichopus japonicus]